MPLQRNTFTALLTALLGSATALAQTSPPATNPADQAHLLKLGKRDRRVHDPSTLIRCGDEFWLFSTGMGVSSHHSKDLLTWQPGPPVFTKRPAWTLDAVPGHRGGEQGHYWAPDVIHLSGGYFLYYSVSTFGKNTSAIGVATSPTLDPADPSFKWTDHGIVIRSREGLDNLNAIDPAVTLDQTGRLWMSFGSFWSGIKLVELDPKTGLRIAEDSPLYSLANSREIEAPYIHFHDGHYYLFVNWGLCCRGANSTYNIRVGRSKSITGPYLDKAGKDLLHNGGSVFLSTDGPFVGPGHLGIFQHDNRFLASMHFYDATTPRGQATLAIRNLHWANDGWPVID